MDMCIPPNAATFGVPLMDITKEQEGEDETDEEEGETNEEEQEEERVIEEETEKGKEADKEDDEAGAIDVTIEEEVVRSSTPIPEMDESILKYVQGEPPLAVLTPIMSPPRKVRSPPTQRS